MNTLLKDRDDAEFKIGLLGASFDTGNLGVSALAESSIKVILHRWPEAEIIFLDSSGVIGERRQRIGDMNICIKELPIRFCMNIFHENHFLVLYLYALLFMIFRWEKFKSFCARRNPSLKCITQMSMVVDITGGDSFSDIYGMRRFVLGFLRKCLVLLFNKDLVMLPQTYGPFKKKISNRMAAYILKRAKTVYSRDEDGVQCVRQLLNDKDASKVKLSPDIAFVLDAKPWDDKVVIAVNDARKRGRQIVGLNISGLLYNGGYTRDNMFGLAVNYPKLVKQIVDYFLSISDITVVLVPHVFPEEELAVESDPVACKAVYDSLTREQQENIISPDKQPDQGQVKYLIGKCDFFVGSRMHSCIAAFSQKVPTVAVAYSDKFAGVFESVGIADCVIDARICDEKQIIEKIESVFKNKDMIYGHLEDTMHKAKENILNIFKK